MMNPIVNSLLFLGGFLCTFSLTNNTYLDEIIKQIPSNLNRLYGTHNYAVPISSTMLSEHFLLWK